MGQVSMRSRAKDVQDPHRPQLAGLTKAVSFRDKPNRHRNNCIVRRYAAQPFILVLRLAAATTSPSSRLYECRCAFAPTTIALAYSRRDLYKKPEHSRLDFH